jgi:hypothetical protein
VPVSRCDVADLHADNDEPNVIYSSHSPIRTGPINHSPSDTSMYHCARRGHSCCGMICFNKCHKSSGMQPSLTP